MLKIVVNVNRKDVTLSYTLGQTFPRVEGKLVSVEASGKELNRLVEKREIPLHTFDTVSLIWYGRHAGRVLWDLHELFDR